MKVIRVLFVWILSFAYFCWPGCVSLGTKRLKPVPEQGLRWGVWPLSIIFNVRSLPTRLLQSRMPNPAPVDSGEYQKMISGQEYPFPWGLWYSYIALDPILVKGRLQAKRSCKALNDTIGDPENLGATALATKRSQILDSLLGSFDPHAVEIEPPFWCDYGYNLRVGKGFYCNYNCCILGTVPWYVSD